MSGAHLATVQSGAGQHRLLCGRRQREQPRRVALRLNGVQQAQVCKVVDQHFVLQRHHYPVASQLHRPDLQAGERQALFIAAPCYTDKAVKLHHVVCPAGTSSPAEFAMVVAGLHLLHALAAMGSSHEW